MAVFSLNYSFVADSIAKANKTASYLGEYVKDMDSVVKDCGKLAGSDSKGYVNTATDLVKKKIQKAKEERDNYASFSKQMQTLEDFAREKDAAVAKSIDVTVSNYIGKRTIGQKIGDWIYSRYIDFLDGVSSFGPVGKVVAQGIRIAGNWVSETTVKARNWFKYSDGKYLWDSFKAITGAVVAIVGIITAAVAVVTAATPVLLAVALIGLGAATVYACMKMVDASVAVDQNMKAWDLARQYRKSTEDKDETDWWKTDNDEGSLTAARYYGDTQGVKDWIDKTDFGGAVANTLMEGLGETYQFVEDVAKVTSTVCQLVVAVGNAQYVQDAAGNWVKYKSGETVKKSGNFFQNIRTSYLEKCGYQFKRTTVFNKYSLNHGKMTIVGKDYSKAFKLKFFEGYGKTLGKLGYDVKNEGIIGGLGLVIMNGSKWFKGFDGIVSNVETLHDWDSGKTTGFKDGYEAVDAAISLNQKVSFFNTFTSDGSKALGLLTDSYDKVKNLVAPPENAYKAYLQTLSAK